MDGKKIKIEVFFLRWLISVAPTNVMSKLKFDYSRLNSRWKFSSKLSYHRVHVINAALAFLKYMYVLSTTQHFI